MRPRQPLHILLIGLAATAGWLDALSFSSLGQVFTSFQSGNFIFLGLAVDEGDTQRLVGAGASLTAFLIGTIVASYVVGRGELEQGDLRRLVPAFELQWLLLVVLAAWWQQGTPAGDSVARVGMVAIAAAAMGMQGAAVLALRIPGVVTNAMTATLMLGGALLGLRARGEQAADGAVPVSLAFIAAMCGTYVLSALAVGAIDEPRFTALVPVAALTVTLLALRRRSLAPSRRLQGVPR